MEIGIPKEHRDLDVRVQLGVNTVAGLTGAGHKVWVQSHAGEGAGFSDEGHARAGATIVYSAEEVYKRSQLICRVGTPSLEEIAEMEPGQIICGFAHLSAASPQRMARLLKSGVTVLAYHGRSADAEIAVVRPERTERASKTYIRWRMKPSSPAARAT